MQTVEYDRKKVLDYANSYAITYNPRYYDFTNLGGDCTNFVSQCLYAGSKIMNYTPNTGWYYNSLNSRSPSWTSVEFLYEFLINNDKKNNTGSGYGPYAKVTGLDEIKQGDIIQLAKHNDYFHAVIVVGFYNGVPLVASHTRNVYNYLLSNFYYEKLRCLHILGVRKP